MATPFVLLRSSNRPLRFVCELDRRSTIQGQYSRNLSAEEDLNSDFRPKEACFPGPDYLQNDLVLLFCCSLVRFSPSTADLDSFSSRIGMPLLFFIVLPTCLACDRTGILPWQLLCQLEDPRNALVIKARALLGSGLTPGI